MDARMQALEEQTRNLAVANIFELETAIKKLPNSFGKDSPVFTYKHRFVPGIYSREITIPANILLTTEIHASEHIAILSKGSFAFYTESGIEYFKAPHTMVTQIGTKRAMLTFEEVIFTSFHHNPDNILNIEELVEILTFKDERDYQLTHLGVIS